VRKIILMFLIVSSLLVGCLVVLPSSLKTSQGSPPASTRSRAIGPFTSNSVVKLKPGIYRENLEVRANKVSFLGSGVDSTILEGSVTIYGNSCLFRDLTISGDVVILGNNNDLLGASIKGTIASKGNNNIW
jgi:pectin methylesterase-like acyl-CoA thioesterase